MRNGREQRSRAMRKITLRDIVSCIGFLIFSLGACMADGEQLITPTIVTFTGLFIFYFAAKGYEYEEEDYEDD